MDTAMKNIFLVFTGHEFADGGEQIASILHQHQIKASFFFTGDFYRNKKFTALIQKLRSHGHYLGAHSDKHLLYCSWENRDSLLVDRPTFVKDVRDNYTEMQKHGIALSDAPFFMPPFEWYNRTIAQWTRELGLQIINFTPGTSSNADYTIPEMTNYVTSDTIVTRILRFEKNKINGLNGFILLSHIGTDARRTDKFYSKLDGLLAELKRRGYSFRRL